MTSQLKSKKNRPNRRLEHIVQSRQINVQQEVESTKIPPLSDGSTSWFKNEELIDDWLDLTVLEAEKRGPALKTDLSEMQNCTKGLLDRRATDGVKIFGCALRPPEILSIHSS